MGNQGLLHPAYLAFNFATFALLLRPGEIVEGWEETPFYEVPLLIAFGLCIQELQFHFSWRMLRWQPVTLCVSGMIVAIMMSHLTHMYLGGMVEGVIDYFKILIYYGVTITVINSLSRLKYLLFNIAVGLSMMNALCVLDFFEIQDFEWVTPLNDYDGEDEEDTAKIVLRMRGWGIFEDPNDTAMAITAAGVICWYFLCDKQQRIFRFLWIIPIVLLAIGLLCTKSRGGLLATGIAGITLIMNWCGPKLAAVVGSMGICAIPFLSGRQSSGLEEGTASERLELWLDGFTELRSPQILFGIGQNTFSDVMGLVAHNLYVHTYVELGLFGGTLFFGMYYFGFYELLRIAKKEFSYPSPELQRLCPYMFALLAGWCGSILSLSRAYVVPTYMIVGIVASYCNMAGLHTDPPRPAIVCDQRQVGRLAVASLIFFVSLYLFARIFA